MLMTGQADGIGQFTVGEPLLAKAAAPKEVLGLAYADAGLDMYSSVIIATDTTIKNNPDLLKRFVAATMQGLKDAMADPKEAGAILHKHQRHVDADIGAGETAKVAQIAVQPGLPLGALDPVRVKKTIDFTAGAFQLKTPVSADDVSAPGFVSN
jgi:NitT/TauT family transport system substrate-binding protein